MEERSGPYGEATRRQVFVETQNGIRETPHLFNVPLEQIMGLPPPLGLRLQKTPSAVKEINNILKARERDKQNASMAKKKFKAASFSATLLKIGEFSFEPLYEADLVAKCHFAMRRLVWEVLDRSTNIKKKVEVPWENILAIRAVTDEHRPGILEIELQSQPAFYHENNTIRPPRPTMWVTTQDFTGGHASRYRRHYLEFPPGVLGKQYQKLLQSDDRLLHLSQRPFPSLESPYFDSALLNEGAKDNDHVNVHDLNGWETNPTSHQQQPELAIPPQQAEQYGNTCTKASSSSFPMHSTPPPTLPVVEIHVNVFNNNPIPQDPEQDNGNFGDFTSTWQTDSDFETQMANVEQVSWEQPNNENYIDIFMERATPLTSHSGVSMEANPAYNNGNTSTQIEYHLPNNAMVNSMEEPHTTNYGLEGHYSATATSSNGNMNGYGMHNGVLYDPHDYYIHPVQATNFNLENHLPLNQHNPSNGNMNGYSMHDGFLYDPQCPHCYNIPPVHATNGNLENHLPHNIPRNPNYSSGAHDNLTSDGATSLVTPPFP